MASDHETQSNQSLPTARVAQSPRYRAVWLIPVAALAIVIWLCWSAWVARGVSIEVEFAQGHGIKPGDAVRHRGIDVGVVREVGLTRDLDRVVIRAAIESWAQGLCREGTTFWIVRPELGLHRVSGLDTIIGARYLALAAAPNANAPERRRFMGHDEAPINESMSAGDRRIVLRVDRRGGLVAGSPVTYRQIEVGAVIGVGLASDATSVEVVAVIAAPYANLVRENSKFWKAGGVDLNLGLKGFSARVDSFESFVAGGIAFATPDPPGATVQNDVRFDVAETPDKEWLEWSPAIPIEVDQSASR